MSAGETFTCITCRLIFNDGEAQRAHYRTAWHCFNLKRKVAGLPPVAQDVFDMKVQALRSETAADSRAPRKHQNPKKVHKFSKGKNRNKGGNMSAVAMEFGPLEDKKPIEDDSKKKDKEVDIDVDETQSMTEEEMVAERLRTAKAIPTNESLFDGHVSNDLETNLEYMRRNFGFFVPEVEALTDLDGLIAYLGEKVGIGYTCLYCEKAFHSLTAARSHMVDVSHCKIKFYESLEEFEDFYNLGEESDEEESESTDKLTSNAPIVQNDQESWTPGLPLSDSSTGSELILPSGSTIGHRALRVYYRQRARPQETRQSVLVNQLIRQYKDLGYLKKQHHSEITRYRAARQEHLKTKMQISANKLPKYMRHKECMT